MQTIVKKTLTDTMTYNNITVFVYTINYPAFASTCSEDAAQLITRHYEQASKSCENYCRTVLYPQAVDTAKYMQPGQPFNYYEVYVDYKITYNQECITSLFIDAYTYMGGAHGETKRTSDTWNFNTGTRLELNDIYSSDAVTPDQLKDSITRQIKERLKENPGIYFENYTALLRQAFNPLSFYLIPGHFVIYYQQYDIAPYSTGLPEFTFPIKVPAKM